MNNLSVLIPVYNTRPAALLEAVFSMTNQTIDKDVKILLVDDGSTSNDTRSMLLFLETNKNLYKEVAVHYMDKNGGTSAVMNKGHELLDSEYIAVMGSDDVSDSNRLLLQMKYLEANKNIDVLGTNLFSFYDDDIRRTPVFTSNHKARPTLADSAYGWLVNHGTVVYKNQSVKDVGGYDIGYRRAQDVNLWKRMAEKGKTFANIPEVLYAWRRFR